MLIHRNIKASVRTWLVDLMTDPPAEDQASGIPAYNVYGESEVADSAHTPTSPWIYVLDGRTPLYTAKSMRLPALILEMETTASSFMELGSRQRGHYVEVVISVYGRNRAEQDDLLSFLEKNLTTIPIYNYSEDEAVLLETAVIEPSAGVADVRISDALNDEGSLSAWGILTFAFATWH